MIQGWKERSEQFTSLRLISQSDREPTVCYIHSPLVLWCCAVCQIYERKHETAERTKDVLFVQEGETGRGGGVRE